jgi:internalin A
LKELYVICSSESDWTFIENMINLQFLFISDTCLYDLNFLGNLGKKQNEVYEKEQLQGQGLCLFWGLRNLHLTTCNIVDISQLAYCNHLSDLNLSHNTLTDLKPLSGISSLYWLTLRYCGIQDIAPLRGLTGLYFLNLRHNRIKDISIFQEFRESFLGRLFIHYNPIKDYSPLKKICLVESDVSQYTQRAAFMDGVKLTEEGEEFGTK